MPRYAAGKDVDADCPASASEPVGERVQRDRLGDVPDWNEPRTSPRTVPQVLVGVLGTGLLVPVAAISALALPQGAVERIAGLVWGSQPSMFGVGAGEAALEPSGGPSVVSRRVGARTAARGAADAASATRLRARLRDGEGGGIARLAVEIARPAGTAGSPSTGKPGPGAGAGGSDPAGGGSSGGGSGSGGGGLAGGISTETDGVSGGVGVSTGTGGVSGAAGVSTGTARVSAGAGAAAGTGGVALGGGASAGGVGVSVRAGTSVGGG